MKGCHKNQFLFIPHLFPSPKPADGERRILGEADGGEGGDVAGGTKGVVVAVVVEAVVEVVVVVVVVVDVVVYIMTVVATVAVVGYDAAILGGCGRGGSAGGRGGCLRLQHNILH